MPSNPPLSFAQVDELVAYDPATGDLTWKVHISRSHKAGQKAGRVKLMRTNQDGKPYHYHYITVRGFQTPGARIAWLLAKGEWPRGNILFVDGDGTNLRINNLRERDESIYAEPLPALDSGARVSRRMTKEAGRRYARKRYYDLEDAEYQAMVDEQGGVCAICEQPSVDKHGKPTELHVDHDHRTGAVRGLLCLTCNAMLGSAGDDEWILTNGAEY